MRPGFNIADSAAASGGSRLDTYLSARLISIFFQRTKHNWGGGGKKKKKKATRPICFSGLRFSLHLVLVYEQIGCLASTIKDKCSRGSKVIYNHVNLP